MGRRRRPLCSGCIRWVHSLASPCMRYRNAEFVQGHIRAGSQTPAIPRRQPAPRRQVDGGPGTGTWVLLQCCCRLARNPRSILMEGGDAKLFCCDAGSGTSGLTCTSSWSTPAFPRTWVALHSRFSRGSVQSRFSGAQEALQLLCNRCMLPTCRQCGSHMCCHQCGSASGRTPGLSAGFQEVSAVGVWGSLRGCFSSIPQPTVVCAA